MGPRPHGRGESIGAIRGLVWTWSFNGATPSWAWRADDLPQARDMARCARFNGATPSWAWRVDDENFQEARVELLQWGHALMGVESPTITRRRRKGFQLQW